jgi:CAAX prenyl protease-like protein
MPGPPPLPPDAADLRRSGFAFPPPVQWTLPSDRRALIGYTAPFAAFVGLMGLEHLLSLPAALFYPLRLLQVAIVLLVFSRPYLDLRPVRPFASMLMGAAVFAIWIAPDLLFHYRGFWLFDNAVIGHPQSTIPPALHGNPAFLVMRAAGATVLVPILEELFWRGWLMRWLIEPKFQQVKFGAYAAGPFWIVAALFASEHGSYWEVGLAAGIAYNWWAIRTRSLADCILAHAATNGILSAYVLVSGQWQYWS